MTDKESERIRAAARERAAATMPPMTPEVAARVAPLIQAALSEQAARDAAKGSAA